MYSAARKKKVDAVKDPDKSVLLKAVGIIESKCDEIVAAERDLATAYNHPGSPRDLELENALDELSGLVQIAARESAIPAIRDLYDNLEDYHSILLDLRHGLKCILASVTLSNDFKSRIHCLAKEFKRISASYSDKINSMSMFQNARNVIISGGQFIQHLPNDGVREKIDTLLREVYLIKVIVLFG